MGGSAVKMTPENGVCVWCKRKESVPILINVRFTLHYIGAFGLNLRTVLSQSAHSPLLAQFPAMVPTLVLASCASCDGAFVKV